MQQQQSQTPVYKFGNGTIREVDKEVIDYVDDRGDMVILVMGPTGAGKSRFIETLDRDEILDISKDQLDSVTQKIVVYEVIPESYWYGPGTEIHPCIQEAGDPLLYILDTPGFSDSQISEVEIIEMVREWMNIQKCPRIDTILYSYPITDRRLPGSKRRTIEMLMMLCRVNEGDPGDLAVMTTMWDRLWNEKSKIAAEIRHEQLRDDVWKELSNIGGYFTQFMNTRESAASILDQFFLTGANRPKFVAFHYPSEPTGFRDAPYMTPLYQDLVTRIRSVEQQRQILETELSGSEANVNQELKSYTEQRLWMMERLLTKFETQLINLGDPPKELEEFIPFREAIVQKRAPAVQSSIVGSTQIGAQRHQATIASPSRTSKVKTLLGDGLRAVRKHLKK